MSFSFSFKCCLVWLVPGAALLFTHALESIASDQNPSISSSIASQSKGASIDLLNGNPYWKANQNEFPVSSHRLSPGRVSNNHKYWPHLDVPLCIVSDDVLSKRWLQLNHQRFLITRTVCLVTDVSSQNAYNVVSKLLADIPHFAASADAIAQHTGIQHYPVWLTTRGIRQ